MSNREELEEALRKESTWISAMKERHRQELKPLEDKRRDIRAELGPIYAGFTVGDILVGGLDRMGRGKMVKVTRVHASHTGGWEAYGITIRAVFANGEERRLLDYQGWKKQQ